MPLYQQNEKYEIVFWIHMFKYLQQNERSVGFVILRLIHPLLRGINVDRYVTCPGLYGSTLFWLIKFL